MLAPLDLGWELRRREQSDASITGVPNALEEWVSDRAFRRLRPAVDLGEEHRVDPDALVDDALRIGLCVADQQLQPLLQVGADIFEAVTIVLAQTKSSPLRQPR